MAASLSLERTHTLYLLALQAQDASPHTLALYGRVLHLHHDWLRQALQKPPTLAHLEPTLTRRWAVWLAEPVGHGGGAGRPPRGGAGGRSPTTLRHYQRILKTFSAWCVAEGLLPNDPLARLKLPREQRIEPQVMTDAELARLAAACVDTRSPCRNRALVLLLADTGVRVSGLCGLDLGDLALPAGKGAGQGRIRVRLKGGDVMGLPFGSKTAQALQHYLLLERDGSDEPTAPLFLGQGGARWKDGAIRKILLELGKAAGIDPSKTHPHALRHYAATSWGAAGMSAFAIQDRLGHSSLEQSRRYVHLGQQRAEVAYSAVDALPIRALPASRRAVRAGLVRLARRGGRAG